MSEPIAAKSIDGRCLCGAVTVHVAHAPDSRPGVCHCRMCQRWSGLLFACIEVPADAIRVSGTVARYASSSFAERAFCPTCGSHLWMRDTTAADTPYDVMPGLFDAARPWPLRSEIYTDCAFASARLAGEHRRASQAEYEAKHPFVPAAG